MVDDDPTVSNPDHYRVLWENERVRVLAYSDEPGESTTVHHHPDSVMVTLTTVRRRLESGDQSAEVELPEGIAVWIPEQSHAGSNIGETPTRTIIVELKGEGEGAGTPSLGPVLPTDPASSV
ncbi:cupin domain-containing protein [Leifsonia aquatica]|uniref:cupin domain-containing protein n=1 Tax=Leifsonia aquatica TaxID=144185 RepID=UPI0028B04AC9|nr:cytoplasmic protein [Leifsonia aquatica]